MTHSDTIFLSDAKKQYKVWKKSYKKRNRKYSNKVKKINETFNLKNTDELNTKLAPQFWSGDIDSNPKFIVVSLNPKLKGVKNNRISARVKKGMKENAEGWKKYKKKRKSWFTEPTFQKSQYWKKIYKLICGMDDKPFTKTMDSDYVTENVLTLNLFPYPSNSSRKFGKSRFSVKQLKIVIHHLDLLFDLIKEKKPEYCFFNGKVWETLLIKHKLFSAEFEKKSYGKKDFRIHLLKKDKIRYVIFNRFLVQAASGEGITDDDLIYGIPKFIKKHS